MPADPFAQPAPVRDLATAPEVDESALPAPAAAQTQPGTRQRRTEHDKAKAVYEVAERKARRLEEKVEPAKAEAIRLEAAAKAARAQADYLGRHPALQGADEPLPGV